MTFLLPPRRWLSKRIEAWEQIISDLARKALRRPAPHSERNGIPLLGTRTNAAPVTLEIVNALRDDLR